MKITINSKQYNFEKSISISDLLKKLNLDNLDIAVEKNLTIISQSSYDKSFIENNDNIEIISFVGGG